MMSPPVDPIQIESRLTKARDSLLDKHPLFSGCMSLKYQMWYDCAYAATDGEHFFYNPTGICELTPCNLEFLWLHEWLHVANLHFTRQEGKKAVAVCTDGSTVSVWNMATDYIINLDCVEVLGEAGFIEGGLLDAKYKGMSSEQVYNLLVKDAKSPPPFLDFGGVKPIEGDSKEEVERAEEIAQRVRKDVKRSFDLDSRRRGGVNTASSVIDKILNKPLDYQDELIRFLQSQTSIDWSYRKVTDRGCQNMLYPTLSKLRQKRPVIAVDTSLSITKEEIQEFVGDSIEIFALIGLPEMDIIYCDWEVRAVETIRSVDQLPKPSGGAGTDFAPVTEHLRENYGEYEALVYYTDGYCDSFGDDPLVPVLWVLTTDIEFDPPFGYVVRKILPNTNNQ